MRSATSKMMFTRFTPKLAGFRPPSWALIALVASGCSQSDDHDVELLPWSNVAAATDTARVEIANLSADAKTDIDAREIEFRDTIVESCLDDLRRIAADPTVVRAVEEANQASWQSQQQIDQTDVRWRQTQGVDDSLVQRYMHNPCADYLRLAQQRHAEYVELFVMDNKGCIVAESDKTSDFWQGDEEKWTECFNNGRGQVFVGDVEYDQSTGAYVVQISVPVFSKDGKTIGAMTVGVCPEKHREPQVSSN